MFKVLDVTEKHVRLNTVAAAPDELLPFDRREWTTCPLSRCVTFFGPPKLALLFFWFPYKTNQKGAPSRINLSFWLGQKQLGVLDPTDSDAPRACSWDELSASVVDFDLNPCMLVSLGLSVLTRLVRLPFWRYLGFPSKASEQVAQMCRWACYSSSGGPLFNFLSRFSRCSFLISQQEKENFLLTMASGPSGPVRVVRILIAKERSEELWTDLKKHMPACSHM